jgi:hypothetical protein
MIKLLDALNSRKPTVEFGRGNDSFKRDFTKSYYELFNIVITKNNLLRFYITFLSTFRMKIYEQVSNHIMLYRIYSLLRNKLQDR